MIETKEVQVADMNDLLVRAIEAENKAVGLRLRFVRGAVAAVAEAAKDSSASHTISVVIPFYELKRKKSFDPKDYLPAQEEIVRSSLDGAKNILEVQRKILEMIQTKQAEIVNVPKDRTALTDATVTALKAYLAPPSQT